MSEFDRDQREDIVRSFGTIADAFSMLCDVIAEAIKKLTQGED